MARRKHHHSRRGTIRIGKWIGLATKIAGGIVIANPLIQAATDAFSTGIGSSQLQYFPSRVLFYYTGVDSNKSYTINGPILTQSIASVGGGPILVKLGSWLGKHVR